MFVIFLLLGREYVVMQKNVLVGQSYVCLEVSDLCLLKVNEAIQMWCDKNVTKMKGHFVY